MSSEMDKQNARAARILAKFARTVNEAVRADLDTPTIERTQPKKHARIKRGVAWRLMAKGRK